MLFKVYRAGVKRDLGKVHPAGSALTSDSSVKSIIVAQCSQLAMPEFIPKSIHRMANSPVICYLAKTKHN